MDVNPNQRRCHSAEFKAQVLAACREPEASVAAVALSFKLNDNLMHQWLPMALDPRGGSSAIGSIDGDCRVCAPVHRAVVAPAITAALSFGASGCFYLCCCRGDSPGVQARRARRERDLAGLGRLRLRRVAARGAAMIRIDALWLCTKPVDMRAGAERLLVHVVHALGSANAHHGTCLPMRGPRASRCSCTTALACGARRDG